MLEIDSVIQAFRQIDLRMVDAYIQNNEVQDGALVQLGTETTETKF